MVDESWRAVAGLVVARAGIYGWYEGWHDVRGDGGCGGGGGDGEATSGSGMIAGNVHWYQDAEKSFSRLSVHFTHLSSYTNRRPNFFAGHFE